MEIARSYPDVAQVLIELAEQKERERRKQEHAALRPHYQREWDRRNRSFLAGAVTGETLRREHDLAAMELSRERYR